MKTIQATSHPTRKQEWRIPICSEKQINKKICGEDKTLHFTSSSYIICSRRYQHDPLPSDKPHCLESRNSFALTIVQTHNYISAVALRSRKTAQHYNFLLYGFKVSKAAKTQDNTAEKYFYSTVHTRLDSQWKNEMRTTKIM